MKYTIIIMLAGLLGYFGFVKSGHKQVTEINNRPIGEVTVYDFTMKNIEGKEVSLSDYKGKVLIFVNVASKCGLTPQYEEIEAFYKEYKAKGVEVLGFPANNFMGQEPGSDEQIQGFCSKNYGVTFPMFSKISVKGDDIHPLYQYLTSVNNESVKWNFQKFLVGKDGKVVTTFSPKTHINEKEVIQAIEAEIVK